MFLVYIFGKFYFKYFIMAVYTHYLHLLPYNYLLNSLQSNFLFFLLLHWIFVTARKLSLVAASSGYSSFHNRDLIVVASPVVECRF